MFSQSVAPRPTSWGYPVSGAERDVIGLVPPRSWSGPHACKPFVPACANMHKTFANDLPARQRKRCTEPCARGELVIIWSTLFVASCGLGVGKRFVFFASPALLAYFVQVKGAWRAKRFQGRRQQRHGGSNTGGDGWNEGQKQKHNTGGRHVVLVISIGRHSEAHIVPPHLHTVVCAAMSQIHSTHTVFCR